MAELIPKRNSNIHQKTNPCDQFITEMSPSQSTSPQGDIDCCEMLNGNMIGPYGGVATLAMLETHCDVGWSIANLGGGWGDGNQLGTSLGWANCCGGGCPPTNLNSPYHMNHNEFCANCGPGAYYHNHIDCPCCSGCPPTNLNSPYYTNYPEFCYEQVPGSGIYYHQQPGMFYHNHQDGDCCDGVCPPTDLNSPYYTNYPEFCYEQVPGSGIYHHQQPGMFYHNHPDGDCCDVVPPTQPQVGQYYCNSHPQQGNSCTEIISGPSNDNGWIPGQPTSHNVANVSLSWGPFYDTLQDCEASCSNHYPWNCWDYDNGNTSPNVSFPHISEIDKTEFCRTCNTDEPGSIVKSHPYCWCIDSGAGPHITPHAGTWSFPPNVHNC